MNIWTYQYITYQYINWRKAGVLSKPAANMFTRICLLEYVYWRHRSVFSISLIYKILNNWRGMEVAYLKISISLTINNLLKTPHKSLNGFIQKACMVASKSLMVASKKLVWLRPKSLYGCVQQKLFRKWIYYLRIPFYSKESLEIWKTYSFWCSSILV